MLAHSKRLLTAHAVSKALWACSIAACLTLSLSSATAEVRGALTLLGVLPGTPDEEESSLYDGVSGYEQPSVELLMPAVARTC